MLLIIAGLFTRSLAEAQKTNLGFDPNHVVNFVMDPNEIGYNEAQGREFYKNLLARVRALPGVVSASTANSTPLGYYNNGDTWWWKARNSSRPVVTRFYLQCDFYRLFQNDGYSDAAGAFVHRRRRSEHAVRSHREPGNGKKILDESGPNRETFQNRRQSNHSIAVVGVAGDSRYSGMSGEFQPISMCRFCSTTLPTRWQPCRFALPLRRSP